MMIGMGMPISHRSIPRIVVSLSVVESVAAITAEEGNLFPLA
jgi:hypothetical protein